MPLAPLHPSLGKEGGQGLCLRFLLVLEQGEGRDRSSSLLKDRKGRKVTADFTYLGTRGGKEEEKGGGRKSIIFLTERGSGLELHHNFISFSSKRERGKKKGEEGRIYSIKGKGRKGGGELPPYLIS